MNKLTPQQEAHMRKINVPRMPMTQSEKDNFYFRKAPSVWPYAMEMYFEDAKAALKKQVQE